MWRWRLAKVRLQSGQTPLLMRVQVFVRTPFGLRASRHGAFAFVRRETDAPSRTQSLQRIAFDDRGV
jgi:hypothetical protein